MRQSKLKKMLTQVSNEGAEGKLSVEPELPCISYSHSEASNEMVARLYREYNDALVRYLSVKLRSTHDAEEVAQEAYARMLGIDQPNSISHLQAYLFKIASNIAIDRVRVTNRRPVHCKLDGSTIDIRSSTSPPDAAANAQRQVSQLRKIVEDLPPKCRKAFLLYKFEGLSYGEIAERMNLTESMIRKYVLRALVYSRESLGAEVGGNLT
jgi:RNA polymerase sigma-70 factor (ECF subfamily)